MSEEDRYLSDPLNLLKINLQLKVMVHSLACSVELSVPNSRHV